jgi:glycosyltransferase involved in cell wall biosynthesis
MKIAVFTRSTTKHFISGGMETHLKNLVEGLASRDHDITVITTAHPSNINENFEETDNKVKYFFIKETTPGLNPLSNWEKIFSKLGFLNRGVKEERGDYFIESRNIFNELDKKEKSFDAIISQSTGAYGIYEYTSLPILSIIHGTIKTEMKNRWRSLRTFKNFVRFFIVDIPKWAYESAIENKKFFEKVTKIVAVSEKLKEDFVDDYRNLESKTVVIPNGVDVNIFKPLENGKEKFDKFTILYVGRMELEKGVDILIRALDILNKEGITSNLKTLLIGDGIHVEHFKSLAKDLSLEDKIEFLGNIKNTELPNYYSKSHVFALPSRRAEGHPMTISEAMCSGLILLTTNSGGLRNLYEDGKEGFFITDEESLAEKIKYLYNNKDILIKMSEMSYHKGIKDYSKNAMIEKYVSCLKSL